jgi:hypothetical protein
MNILKRIFLTLFIISTLVVLVMAVNLNRIIVSASSAPTSQPSDTPGTPQAVLPETEPSAQAAQNAGALIGSVIASATSLIGFLMTTLITWRKEKRDSALADVEYRKLETELEKSKLELEKLKKAAAKKKTKK